MRWRGFKDVAVYYVHVPSENSVHSVTAFAVTTTPVLSILEIWIRGLGKNGRVTEIAFCTHDGVCTCFLQAVANIMVLKDVSVRKDDSV